MESEAGQPTYPMVPFSLILASSMAKVMWSWCSMPRATRLNATWNRMQEALPILENYSRAPHYTHACTRTHAHAHARTHTHTHPGTARRAPYLEEVLGDDGEALRVVGDALQVRVLVQDVVVDVQEELQGVLVQEVYLEVAEVAVSACARGAGAPGRARRRSPASATPW